MLALDRDSGAISFNRLATDFNDNDDATVVLMASDGGFPKRSTLAQLKVKILNFLCEEVFLLGRNPLVSSYDMYITL